MISEIEVEDLHLHLGPRSSGIDALDGVSLHVDRGERLGLVGESGSGKSTLLKVMMALREPDSGVVRFRGRPLSDAATVRDLRRSVAIVFQDPRSSLDPRMNIGQAITEPLRSPVALRMTRQERKDRLTKVMTDVGLDPEATSRFPHEFSGGQRQRIAIARALVTEPDVLLADEPVSALDVSVRAQVLNLLNDLVSERGLTMVFVSHDLTVVRHLCDTVAVMSAGRIVERGRLSEVYRDPQHEVTQELLAAIPHLRVDDSTL